MNNKKRSAANTPGLTELDNQLLMENLTPNTIKFQYHCSFCACELPDDGARFNGVGACPACDDLAHLWVNSLRQYAANYSNNLGVRK
jgi:hypothetical protein